MQLMPVENHWHVEITRYSVEICNQQRFLLTIDYPRQTCWNRLGPFSPGDRASSDRKLPPVRTTIRKPISELSSKSCFAIVFEIVLDKWTQLFRNRDFKNPIVSPAPLSFFGLSVSLWIISIIHIQLYWKQKSMSSFANKNSSNISLISKPEKWRIWKVLYENGFRGYFLIAQLIEKLVKISFEQMHVIR